MNLSNQDREAFSALIKSIHVTIKEFDEFLSTTPHMLRSIRGHAFEVWFDREMEERGYHVKKIGGDNVVDRIINKKSLQLKTPFLNGTVKNKTVQYKMHKTHGAERKPFCFYKKDEFADFFVGLHPIEGVIICPGENLTTRGEINSTLDYKEYIADPLPFSWNTEWINRYELLGIKVDDPPIVAEHMAEESILLPQTISLIGFTDFDIVKAILDPSNFRIWRQLIRGSIREFHFKRFAQKKGINLRSVSQTHLNGRGRQKVDFFLDNDRKVQVKGLTLGLCRDGILGCETQCSHGRIPTRLYRTDDFDYLAIVIDPGMLPTEVAQKQKIKLKDYNFLIVPMEELPVHPKSKEWDFPRIKSSYLFDPFKQTYNKVDLLNRIIRN